MHFYSLFSILSLFSLLLLIYSRAHVRANLKLRDKFLLSILSFDSFFSMRCSLRSRLFLFGPETWRTSLLIRSASTHDCIYNYRIYISIIHTERVQEIQYRFCHHRRSAEVFSIFRSVMLLEIRISHVPSRAPQARISHTRSHSAAHIPAPLTPRDPAQPPSRT